MALPRTLPPDLRSCQWIRGIGGAGGRGARGRRRESVRRFWRLAAACCGLCSLMATITTRYGYSELVTDPDDPWIVRKLIAELRTEQFDEPDDEHTQVFCRQ